MLLKQWLEKEKISNSKFCDLLNMHRSTLTQYFNGYRRFTPRVCEKIEELTNGEVSRNEAMWPELYDSSWKYKKRKKSSEEKQ